MDKLLFPEVLVHTKDDGYVDLEERFTYQYPIIMEYLKKKIAGKNIGDFYLEKHMDKGICLYAVTEFTDLVIDDFRNKGADITLYLCDKKAEYFVDGYKGINVIDISKLKELYDKGEIKNVLICNVFHRNAICKELINVGIKLDDIYSVIEVICTGL